MADEREPSAWWSDFEVRSGQGLQWNLGAFRLVAYRKEGEWLLAHECATGQDAEDGLWQVTPVSEAPADDSSPVRFVTARAVNIVKLVPRAADRPVVAKPHLPLHLLAGESAKIYVSSPAWVSVTVGRPMQSLCEVPIQRLSDTWFGPNTWEGDEAYALKTRARVELAEIPMRTYRIITPIKIRNDGEDPLRIDRMNLPVPYLSVYTAKDGFLWTEAVTLVQSQVSDLASLEVGKGAPQEAKGARQLSEPRQAVADNFLVRAFSSLLAPFQEEN